jgi:hypothetical protein
VERSRGRLRAGHTSANTRASGLSDACPTKHKSSMSPPPINAASTNPNPSATSPTIRVGVYTQAYQPVLGSHRRKYSSTPRVPIYWRPTTRWHTAVVVPSVNVNAVSPGLPCPAYCQFLHMPGRSYSWTLVAIVSRRSDSKKSRHNWIVTRTELPVLGLRGGSWMDWIRFWRMRGQCRRMAVGRLAHRRIKRAFFFPGHSGYICLNSLNHTGRSTLNLLIFGVTISLKNGV